MRARGAVAAFFTLTAAALAAQQQPPQPPTFRAGVDLIAVDVQVVDKSGAPVRGLTADQFTVTIDGRKRRVVTADFMDYQQRARVDASGSAAAAGAASTSSANAAAPAAPVRVEETFPPDLLLIIDCLTLKPGDARGAAVAAQGFLARVPADQRVGVFAYPTGPKMNPTTDHASVAKALDTVIGQYRDPIPGIDLGPSEVVDAIANSLGCGSGGGARVTPIGRGAPSPLGRIRGTFGEQFPPLLAGGPECGALLELESTQAADISTLRNLFDSWGKVPGRKIAILVTGGMITADYPGGRPNVDSSSLDLGRAAASADISVYSLFMDRNFLDSNSADRQARNLTYSHVQRDSDILARWPDLFAGSAGGTMERVITGNGEQAYEKILRETSAAYLLGVEPQPSDGNGRPHQLKVMLNRGGVFLRSRSWFQTPAHPDAQTTAFAAVAGPKVSISIPVLKPWMLDLPMVAPAWTLAPSGTTTDASLIAPVLARVGAYLAAYRPAVASLVAEENYLQEFQAQGSAKGVLSPDVTRQLRSDILMLTDSRVAFGTFRDVLEVDGRPLHDHDDRLARLILDRSPDAVEQARRMATEGARYNLDIQGLSSARTINVPMGALLYLLTENQARSSFRMEPVTSSDGRSLALLRFVEFATPRIVRSADNVAMNGTALIDVPTGRVLQTTLSFTTGTPQLRTDATINVVYAMDSKTGLLLPDLMDERYEALEGRVSLGVLQGHATYANVRVFQVDVTSSPATIPAHVVSGL